MRRSLKYNLPMVFVLLCCLGGCDPPPPEEKLIELAQESVQQQASQNRTIARQGEAGMKEREQIVEAAKELIVQHAEARRELIDAQQKIASEFHVERERIDQQKIELEQERRELAQERNRDPIVAATLQGVGMLLAAILPLVICLFVLYQLYGRDSSTDAAVTELLLTEITADHPILLSSPSTKQPPMLMDKGSDDIDLGPEDVSHFT